MAARRARRDGRELTLTVREFDLLAFFMSHPGQAFTRAELMKRVWGWSFGTSPPSPCTCAGFATRSRRNRRRRCCCGPSAVSATAGTQSPRRMTAGQISPTRKVGRPPAAPRHHEPAAGEPDGLCLQPQEPWSAALSQTVKVTRATPWAYSGPHSKSRIIRRIRDKTPALAACLVRCACI